MTQTGLCQEKNRVVETKRMIRLVALNSRYIHSCLALFCIRNTIQLHLPDCEIDILQATINDNYHETLLKITAGSPYAVFLSANIWNSVRIEQLVRDIRQSLPDSVLVVGGPQAGEIRKSVPENVCTAVIGEIEAVGDGFFSDLDGNRMKSQYQGSFLRQNIRELDYPFRDEDFSRHLKNRHIYYESSRGCPHSCTYCLSSTEKGLFHKPIDQVEKELTTMLCYSPKVVRFVDRTFNDVPERALAIWKFLHRQESDTLFHFEIAPERFSEEMFCFLEKVKSGRFQFEIGIQSTGEETLRAIRRQIDPARVREIIRRLAAFGTIHLHVDLILGLPFETAESFNRSFADVFDMGAHYIQMGLLKILPDTPMQKSAQQYGYRYSSSPPYSVFANRWLSHEEMSDMYWFCECVEKFHNNRYFVSLWSYLRRTGEDISTFFHELLAVGKRRQLFERAPTQEFLAELLVEHCADRRDSNVIREMLRYDWLRCGFRKLPDCLAFDSAEEDSAATRDLLFRQLPDNLERVYDSRTRNTFFKRSTFLRISRDGCRGLDLDPEQADGIRIAVTSEREKSLYGHNKAVRLLMSAGGDETV